jgi:phosphoribosyl-AMP cyclohydrolase / phosphoribosyl-ATP pyrophosphohydrolase
MKIDFGKYSDGLAPAIVQNSKTRRILMLAFMNREALEITKNSGLATFFSRSRQKLWTKGETSGNFLKVKEILLDCDGDTLLLKVEPTGVVCHTGAETCFGEKDLLLEEQNQGENFLFELERIILDKKKNPSEDSYTTKLFNEGLNKIIQKFGEESIELVIEAKDNDRELFKNEAADLLYHFLVLLSEKNVSLADVLQVLENRRK